MKRGAHISDIHLGVRRLPATINGKSMREVDIIESFMRVIDDIHKAAQLGESKANKFDLITIGGDVFDSPTPSITSLIAWWEGLGKLRAAARQLYVVAGNHDVPKSGRDDIPIMISPLPEAHNCMISATEDLIGGGSITTIPHDPERTKDDTLKLLKAPKIPYGPTILLAHMAVSWDGAPKWYTGHTSCTVPDLQDFDIVLLGDWHEPDIIAPNACYSGAVDRATTNIWAETERRGWMEWEWDGKEVKFTHHAIPIRPVYDLDHWDPEEIINQCEPGSIVRVRVRETDVLDYKLVSMMKEYLGHLQLERIPREAIDVDVPVYVSDNLIDRARKFFADDDDDVRERALSALMSAEQGE